MPLNAIDYSKTVIYKIQHVENESLLYVGHTTNLVNRKSKHYKDSMYEKSRTYNLAIYQAIRSNGGWEKFNMVWIQDFPCKNKREAERQEDKVMREMKSTLNSQRAFLTPEEVAEYKHQHYMKNREEYLRKSSAAYTENREERIAGYRERYKNNREAIRAEMAEKFKNCPVVQCGCGSSFKEMGKFAHNKTKKHTNWVKENQ